MKPRRILENKRHLDGTEHRFECELLALQPNLAIVLFRHWRGRSAGRFRFPRGSRTYGFFWRRRSYSLYRMLAPNGRLIAHRFDVLEDVRLSESEISYLDLFLDIWVAPDGTVAIEDEDEVTDHARRCLVSGAQLRRIARTRDYIVENHRRITREAERLLEDLGR
jgi:predicted RNA-binding protein associated with RNAse of E/G family